MLEKAKKKGRVSVTENKEAVSNLASKLTSFIVHTQPAGGNSLPPLPKL